MLQLDRYKNKFAGKTILVADDVEDVLFYYKALLQVTGIEVVEARSGNEVISICRKKPDIDIIMLDIQMPNGDGMYTLGRLKEMHSRAAVVAQTAHALPSDKLKYMKLGFDDYICKPLRSETLFQILDDHLFAEDHEPRPA